MDREVIARAEEIIGQNTAHGAKEGIEPYCILALMDEDGYPTASVITASRAEGLARITFCTGLESNKAKRIRSSNRACACFASATDSITLVGTIEVLTDAETKREMWYDGLNNHFSSAADPDYCVLSFRTQRYNLFVDWKEARGTL
jgi:general stress protein 26